MAERASPANGFLEPALRDSPANRFEFMHEVEDVTASVGAHRAEAGLSAGTTRWRMTRTDFRSRRAFAGIIDASLRALEANGCSAT
jgi:hypothetical protein